MGYIRHNAIVLTGWNEESISAAAEKARGLGLQVLGPSDAVINEYRSILVCPDGSKEGWAESDIACGQRLEFKLWLCTTMCYEAGSSKLEWVEVSYGSDDETAEIETHAWCKQPLPQVQD